MSQLKVGDRVRMRLCNVIADCVVREIPTGNELYYVVADSDGCLWRCQREELCRLVKRKRPKPAAPDRVMVAAVLLSGVFDNESTPDITKWDQEWLSGAIRTAYALADRIIAEGAK